MLLPLATPQALAALSPSLNNKGGFDSLANPGCHQERSKEPAATRQFIKVQTDTQMFPVVCLRNL